MSDDTGPFFNWLKNAFFKPTKEYTSYEIPLERVDPKPPQLVARANEHYFRIRVAQMFLQRQSALLREYRPVVQSVIEYSFGNSRVEIANVADTAALKLKSSDGDFIARNFTLLPLMPFRGGMVRIAAGLYGMPTTDTLAKYVGTLTQFAKILAVPQLSAALTLAQPVANGIRDAFSEAKLQRLGYYNEFAGADQEPPHLQRRYLALIHAEEDQIPRDSLHVKEDQLRSGGDPFTEYDFMLLRFDVEDKRDDYDQLTAIQTPFAAALNAIASGKPEEAEARYHEALSAVINAAEVTKLDRRRVVKLLKDEYDSTKELVAGAGLRQSPEFDLQRYMNERAISVEEAVHLRDPQYGEFV